MVARLRRYRWEGERLQFSLAPRLTTGLKKNGVRRGIIEEALQKDEPITVPATSSAAMAMQSEHTIAQDDGIGRKKYMHLDGLFVGRLFMSSCTII